jgi:hypothetical protein
MRSHPRQGVWIAIASLVASIALVVWWASARTAPTDAGASGDSASRPDTSEEARAELEVTGNEFSTARAIAASPVTEVAATSEMPDAAELPPGQIRLRLVDAQGQRLTRLKGFLGIERDPRVPSGSGARNAWMVESRTSPFTRRAWNVTIPESGECVFEGLEFGKWNVDCQADGFRQVSVDVSLLESSPRQDIELVVARQRTIEVSFRTPDGEPFLAALKRAFPRYADALHPQLSRAVDSGGNDVVSFTTEIGPARDATYWLTLHAGSMESLSVSAFVADTLLANIDAPADVESVTLVASVDAVEAALGTLSVVVVDQATDRPIGRASVKCSAAEFALRTLIADVDGRVEFEGIIGTKVSVSATIAGYARTTQAVVITPRTRTETIVRLDHGVTISGVMRAEDGSEVFKLAYLASFDEGSNRGTFVGQSQGGRTFTFENLARAHYVAFTSSGTRSYSDDVSKRLELLEPPDVAARNGRLPKGLVYVDARGGSVSNVVLVAPVEAPK